MNELTVAIFLSVANNRIIEAVAAPIRKQFPQLSLWWLIYVAWATGGVLAWLSGVNLFAAIVPTLDPLAGRILTAVVVGGGSNLLADLFQTPK